MATRVRLGALLLCLVGSGFGVASELSDSMQLFFDGRIQQAHQNLNYLVSNGSLDARVFYFRGLANHRLGKMEDANSDFHKAATLELQAGGAGVGQALQRVQGAERLLLEKHRTMARLRTRQRRQPLAQYSAVARNVPVQLNPGASPGVSPSLLVASAPRFRLASEVPLRDLASDRYVNQPASRMLVNDEQSPSAPELSSTKSDVDAPVGTGVVQASSTTEVNEEDPFGDGSADLSDVDDIFSSDDEPQAGQSSGFFGAFRAIGKALTPKVDPTQVIPRGMPIPGIGGPAPGSPSVTPGSPSPEPGPSAPAGDDDDDFPFE